MPEIRKSFIRRMLEMGMPDPLDQLIAEREAMLGPLLDVTEDLSEQALEAEEHRYKTAKVLIVTEAQYVERVSIAALKLPPGYRIDGQFRFKGPDTTKGGSFISASVSMEDPRSSNTYVGKLIDPEKLIVEHSRDAAYTKLKPLIDAGWTLQASDY
jgi:hypothetical protein